MVQQVQLPNSFWVLFVLISCVLGCTSAQNKFPTLRTKIEINANFHSENGILFLKTEPYTGYVFSFYPNTKDTAEVSGFLNGKEHGHWKKYYPNKKLKQQRFFDDGLKVGTYTAWYENGRKQLEYKFLNNEYEGVCRLWNIEGKMIQEMTYHKGYEEGSQKMYYDNGKIRSNYTIKNGRRYGLLGTKNCINVSDSIFKN
jgi:antitoxin component YwqK of YwqJK toxin-antitoxin module